MVCPGLLLDRTTTPGPVYEGARGHLIRKVTSPRYRRCPIVPSHRPPGPCTQAPPGSSTRRCHLPTTGAMMTADAPSAWSSPVRGPHDHVEPGARDEDAKAPVGALPSHHRSTSLLSVRGGEKNGGGALNHRSWPTAGPLERPKHPDRGMPGPTFRPHYHTRARVRRGPRSPHPKGNLPPLPPMPHRAESPSPWTVHPSPPRVINPPLSSADYRRHDDSRRTLGRNATPTRSRTPEPSEGERRMGGPKPSFLADCRPLGTTQTPRPWYARAYF